MAKLPKVLTFDESSGNNGSFGENSERVRTFEAHVSDTLGAEDALYREDRNLQYGMPHPTNDQLRVKRFHASQASKAQKEGSGGWRYNVTVSYSSTVPEPIENPLSVPADIEMDFIQENRLVTADYEGNPLVNRAGQLIEGVEDVSPLVVFSLRKNIPPDIPTWMARYAKAINSDSVTIRGFPCEPKTLQVGRMRIGRVDEINNVKFSVLEMDLVYNPETWVRTFLNRGTVELVVRQEERVIRDRRAGARRNAKKIIAYRVSQEPILDDSGKPISEPQFLTEDGMVPRMDPLDKKERITLKKQIEGKVKTNEDLTIKAPLDPEDIIKLEYTLRKPLPFNSVIPIN